MTSIIRSYFAARKQPKLKLLSWNIYCGGGERISKHVEAIISRQPQVIALQEMTLNSAPKYSVKLKEAGYRYITSSFEVVKNVEFKGKQGYGNLIASQFPIEIIDLEHLGLPQPERVLAVQLKWHGIALDVWNLHVPFTIKGSMAGTLNGMFRYLATADTNKHILCGDFNAPVKYVFNGAGIEGTTKTRELQHFDMIDAFEKHRKFWSDDTTWVNTRQGKTSNFQIDYIFASRMLNSISCKYLHKLREQRLSDHSAIEAVFQPEIN
jgi:endonuclease/exonuclease/phosphatase family metal-dependent hydrolase